MLMCIADIVMNCREKRDKPLLRPHFSRKSGPVEVERTFSQRFNEDVSENYNSICLTSAMLINIALAVMEAIIGIFIDY